MRDDGLDSYRLKAVIFGFAVAALASLILAWSMVSNSTPMAHAATWYWGKCVGPSAQVQWNHLWIKKNANWTQLIFPCKTKFGGVRKPGWVGYVLIHWPTNWYDTSASQVEGFNP